MSVKKHFSILVFLAGSFSAENAFAQQLPDYTQYPSVFFGINPAYTGTKGTIDARMDYRKQWMGYDGAPVTQFAGLHSRLWKGRIGVGGLLYKDQTGPTQRFNYNFTAAYHLHFPDVEFSAGFGVGFFKYTIDGSMMTTHFSGDIAVANAINNALTSTAKNKNVCAGLLLYNDRFHFGLSVLDLLNNDAKFNNKPDSTYKADVAYAAHYYFTFGYNFNANIDYLWENNLMMTYVNGLPLTINYNLRLHYKEKFLVGTGWRLKDAVYGQVGYVFKDRYQIIYTYDFCISHLHKASSGTHEIMLGYRFDMEGGKKGGYKNFNDFQKQKYHIF